MHYGRHPRTRFSLIKGLTLFLGVGLCGSFAPPPLGALGEVLLPSARAQSEFAQTTEMKSTECWYKGQRHDRNIDGVDYGEVTFQLESLTHHIEGFGARPIKINGLIIPGLDVGGPGQIPKPSAGLNTDVIRDVDPGYMFGLQLGGPNIAENTVPEWTGWLDRAQWQAAEQDLLRRATEVAAQNRSPEGKPTKTVRYDITIHYRDTIHTFPGLAAWSFPADIVLNACVADIGTRQCDNVYMKPIQVGGTLPPPP